MASRERPTKTLDSVQLIRSTHAGEIRTLFPGHQFSVATFEVADRPGFLVYNKPDHMADFTIGRVDMIAGNRLAAA